MFAFDANRHLARKCGWWVLHDPATNMSVLHRDGEFLTAQIEEELWGDEKRKAHPKVDYCQNPELVSEMLELTADGKHRATFLSRLERDGQEAAAMWLVEHPPK